MVPVADESLPAMILNHSSWAPFAPSHYKALATCWCGSSTNRYADVGGGIYIVSLVARREADVAPTLMSDNCACCSALFVCPTEWHADAIRWREKARRAAATVELH